MVDSLRESAIKEHASREKPSFTLACDITARREASETIGSGGKHLTLAVLAVSDGKGAPRAAHTAGSGFPQTKPASATWGLLEGYGNCVFVSSLRQELVVLWEGRHKHPNPPTICLEHLPPMPDGAGRGIQTHLACCWDGLRTGPPGDDGICPKPSVLSLGEETILSRTGMSPSTAGLLPCLGSRLCDETSLSPCGWTGKSEETLQHGMWG